MIRDALLGCEKEFVFGIGIEYQTHPVNYGHTNQIYDKTLCIEKVFEFL